MLQTLSADERRGACPSRAPTAAARPPYGPLTVRGPRGAARQHAPRPAYILMDRILPPASVGLMLRRGVLTELETVSELGIYGVFLRWAPAVLSADSDVRLLG